MYSIDTISPLEFTMTFIVCIGYISGKLWMYYRIDSKDTKDTGIKRIKSGRKSRVIKRGKEWDED